MPASSTIYVFGECELDEGAWELRRLGERVALQPKLLELLVFLVRSRDRAVSKRELMEALWPGVVVGESSLTRAVSLVRRAIGDTEGRDGAIRTYARKGYRFCADTAERSPVPHPRAREAESGNDPACALLRGGPPQRGGVRLPVDLPFAGREDALARLADAEAAADGGLGHVLLVVGPDGVGKSRLLHEGAGRARARGARVVRARCSEPDGAPPLWPWLQTLRQLVDDAPGTRRIADGAATRDALRRLCISLESPAEATELPSRERSRFHIFDGIARALALAAASGDGPLVVMLDDVHHIDAGSASLLRYVAEELPTSRCLLIAALRETPEPDDPAVKHALLRLRLTRSCRELRLVGLTATDIEGMLLRAIGRPPAALVDSLAHETQGNPLYLREALRSLEDRGALDDWHEQRDWSVRLGGGARAAIQARIDALPPGERDVLERAAVLGRELRLDLLVATTNIPRAKILDVLDAATHGALVTAIEPPMRYAFAHAVVHEVLYEGIPSARRVELHRLAGECLERRHAHERDRVLPELAQHFFLAADGECEKAIGYALAAARRADALMAHEDAALCYSRARSLLESQTPVDADRRLRVLLELGRAHGASGNSTARREAYREAAAAARALARPDAFARAALGHLASGEWRTLDDASRDLLEESLECVVDPGLRARILSRLTHAGAALETAGALSREALRMAERSSDPEALCEAFHAHHYVLEGPDHAKERARLAAEIVRTGARASREDLIFEIRLEQLADHLMCGERSAAERELSHASRLAARSKQPWFRWLEGVTRAGLALLDGELELAEPAIERAAAQGRALENAWAVPFFVAQRIALERARSAPQALATLARWTTYADIASTRPLGCAMRAGVELAVGRPDGAREILHRFARLEELPRDATWLSTLVELAHVAASLRSREHCTTLYDLLHPYGHLHAVLPYVIAYGGPVAFALARLAVAGGDASRGAMHADTALDAAQRVGAHAWRARIEAERNGLRSASRSRACTRPSTTD